MSGAAVVMIIAVVLIVLALVLYLVSTIVELRRIAGGLDEVIAGVGEIVEKSEPVNGIVGSINEQLDAGVDLLEGLLVKKAGLSDAMGLIDSVYPGAAAAGLRNFPESTEVDAPRIGEVYTKERSRSRGSAGRLRSPRRARRRGASKHPGRQPGGAAALPVGPAHAPREPSEVPGHRDRRPRPVRAARRDLSHSADARAIRLRACDQRGRRDRRARAARPEARIIAGGHSLLPMMKLRLAEALAPDRHQRPFRARLHPRAERRDQDRRPHAARRPGEVDLLRGTRSSVRPRP